MKKKHPANDGGLSPREIAKLRSGIRMVWQRTSHARKLVQKRCLTPEGFSKCEGCGTVVAKVAIDHIVPCGAFNSGYIKRMFVSSKDLQGLCKTCHDAKTKKERKRA